MKLPDFEAWAIFAAVADHGSFTDAADALALSKATVSKAIGRLEQELKTSLFHRTSRRLSLTESGAALLPHARRIFSDGNAAEEAARDEAASPTGLVRITAPMSFGISHCAPIIAELMRDYPGLSVDLSLDDAHVDLIDDRFDIALRIAALPDSSLRARRLRDVRQYVVAAPSYLQASGVPGHPSELAAHETILYSLRCERATWRFHSATGEEAVVDLAGRLRINNGEAMLPALCAGLGISVLPDFIVDAALKGGQLVSILNDWVALPVALYLVTPPSRIRPRRVEVAIDYLAKRLAG
ncbi:MAG: LysR family transcriptional regulator [Sphingomonadales bacterium]|nr:MAG: LysR family transcriptional regulator [Sphingomonadales bacterium]TNF05145.1 MAG: LysR family transcriptional regulator [Sphingomonadales bacterium]